MVLMTAEDQQEAAWGYNEAGEPRWPAAVATTIAVFLYISLPDRFITGPIWLLPTTVLFILFPLLADSWNRHKYEKPWHRVVAIVLIAVLNLYNIFSLIILINTLTHPHINIPIHGEQLLLVASQIWLTNV